MLSGSPRYIGMRVNGLSTTCSTMRLVRLVGVDHRHILAVLHDLADLDVVEVEDRAQHGALVLDGALPAAMQLDRAAQRLGQCLLVLGGRAHARDAQQHLHDPLHRLGRRRQHGDHHAQRRGEGERGAVRPGDGVGLGQHLAQDQHENGHDGGGVNDARLAERLDQHAGGQRRGQDVDQVVAEQHRADHPLLAGVQPVDQRRRGGCPGAPARACAGARRRSAPSRTMRRRRRSPGEGRSRPSSARSSSS